MSDTIIKVENLSKKYIIGHQQQGRYTALRDVIAQGASKFGRKLLSPFSSSPRTVTEEFFALKNVSFEINEGDRVGIIGRNGAGKSTLLKILSRITDPTSGRIEIAGRVASLLEVGTGFHPELTGRENVYLNGAILGMTRREIKRKFEEIVAFAEVERFLDTPVKHYSSGMYVRLAFAVAAHLEPEILVVDEVLAVGDAQFQKKCMNKMGSVAQEGRTVLFVSHNIGAIRKLCNKAILLQKGEVAASGETAAVVERYLGEVSDTGENVDFAALVAKLPEEPVFKFLSIEVQKHNSGGMRFLSNRDIVLDFSYEVREEKSRLFIMCQLCDLEGDILSETFHNGNSLDPVAKGSYSTRLLIPADSLLPKVYEMRIYAGIFNERYFFRPAISFVFEVVHAGSGNMAYFMRPLSGKVVLPARWQTEKRA